LNHPVYSSIFGYFSLSFSISTAATVDLTDLSRCYTGKEGVDKNDVECKAFTTVQPN